MISHTMRDSRSMYGKYMIEKVRRMLKPGRKYRLTVIKTSAKGVHYSGYEMCELEKCFPKFALFKKKTVKGYELRTCIGYMELANMLVTEEYRKNLMKRLRPDESEAGQRLYQLTAD